jgi:hypothetical protein
LRTLFGVLALLAMATAADQIMLQGRYTAKVMDDVKYQAYRVRAEIKQTLNKVGL